MQLTKDAIQAHLNSGHNAMTSRGRVSNTEKIFVSGYRSRSNIIFVDKYFLTVYFLAAINITIKLLSSIFHAIRDRTKLSINWVEWKWKPFFSKIALLLICIRTTGFNNFFIAFGISMLHLISDFRIFCSPYQKRKDSNTNRNIFIRISSTIFLEKDLILSR